MLKNFIIRFLSIFHGAVFVDVGNICFVVKLAGAFPIRKLYLPSVQRWVLNSVDFGNKTWRKENFILNIGIGYPF